MQNREKPGRIVRPAHIRQVNLQAVLRQMRQMPVFSKIDLARALGISSTTLSKLFAQLEAGGIIERSPEIDKSFGRPKILYRLSTAPQIAAVIIDIHATTLCICDLAGTIQPGHRVSFPTGSDPKTLFPTIGKKTSALWKKTGGQRCRMIGVCIQGLIDAETGQSMLNPNLHWLEGTRPAEEISRRLGIPAVILHEAKAIARAQLAVADSAAETLTIDFSVGVGMSVISNGRYLAGQSGFAGEIGHIIMNPGGAPCGCGNCGCLETVAADRVFFRALENGDRRIAVNDILHWQSIGIAAAINLFNPETVYLHSALFDEIPDYLERIRTETARHALRPALQNCRIQSARAGKLEGTILATIDQTLKTGTTDCPEPIRSC